MYICTSSFVSFETHPIIQHGVRIRGCSYISSRRRIYRSDPAVSCISPSILNISTVELQFYYFQEGRKTAISAKCHWIQGLQSSSTRQNLHSKRQQGSPSSPCSSPCSFPCFQAFYPAETSFYAACGDQQFPVVLPCCSRRGILTG